MMDRQVEMQKLLANWKRSGLSLREFGRRKGLAYTKLVYWRRKFHPEIEQEQSASARSSDRWLPVQVVRDPVASADGMAVYAIRLCNGLRVDVTTGFDAEELTRLVQALSSC